MKHTPAIFKAMLFGIVGGIFGSISMIAPKMISNMQFGMPYNVNWIVSGTMFGANPSNAFVVGILIHFVTGVVIGAIFGIITGKITKFRINKISRGLLFGIIMGVIVFGVFFVPISQNVLAPNLVKLMVGMNPDSTQDIIQQKMQNKLPTVLLSSFGLHILFGTVLGSVTYFMARP